jgi:radical SAM protein with 4Fe4S-binding SPASM domain
MLDRIVVPARLSLIYREGSTLGYNPAVNTWHLLDEDAAEVLRWLRAERDRGDLAVHLERRFAYSHTRAEDRLAAILKWCVLRQLLSLEAQPEPSAPNPDPTNRLLSTVYWICTQACNLRCTYCYQDATVARAHELTTAEGKDLVDQAVDAGVQTFIFTGGEPFSRRDLLAIAAHSRDCGLVTNVITNGHYINKRTIKAVAETFDTVTVSVDHGVPEHHDRNRGDGSWTRAVNAVDLLLEAGVDVDVNSVLAKYGLKDVTELLRFGRGRAVRQHRIIPQFPLGRGAGTREDELSPAQLLALNDQLYRANRDLDACGDTKVRTEGLYSKKSKTRNHCGAGFSEVSVDPEGWVYPCKLLQYERFRTENVRTRRLAAIYDDHAVLRGIRGTVVDTMQPCKTCIIKHHCGGGCRGIHFSFTQEYIQAHPLFCAFIRDTFETHAWQTTGASFPARHYEFAGAEHTGTPVHFIPTASVLRR